MGLKTLSEQFRQDLLRVNLQTPPDVVVGLTDLGGSLTYSAYKDSEGEDAVIHNLAVSDPGNVLDISGKLREYLFKRNIQTPSEIEGAITASQSETMRNLGSIGTDATINWRSVVVDAGTVDNAAMITRMENLGRNKQRDLTDPSESNTEVIGDGYNYTSLLQTIGMPAEINNFTVPNVQSVGDPSNPITKAAQKLDLKINKYIPDEYVVANIRENILNEIYKRTTYVADYTNSLKNFNPQEYQYFSFYNLNSKATVDTLLNSDTRIMATDTMLMNIGAYMLNFNLQARFEQNLYSQTLGRINLYNQNYNSDFPVSTDPLELIRIAKDPLDNLIEKNYTITMPRNFVGKTAQFLLGLEGVVSPFDLWESVDLGGKDLKPEFLATDQGLDALSALDPTSNSSAVASDANANTAKTAKGNKKDDDTLLKKTGGGQRWSLYENLAMNKYSPKFDTAAEMIQFKKNNPKGNYYLGSEDAPPMDILQARPGISIINNNALSSAFNKGFDDAGGYGLDDDIVWTNREDSDIEGVDTASFMAFVADQSANRKSTGYKWRTGSLMDVTQKLLYVGGIDTPIRNTKTKFRDGKMVYSKGNATKKVLMETVNDQGHKYTTLEPWENGFCRTWTKLKPFNKISHLVRYGELIRRERNSVIDRNANYNIYPTKLNVGTVYDQQMLAQDGVRDRFADKNFDKIRARKYMFSIENLAWKDSDKFADLPAFEQGPSGGRVMWFPPYGLTFNESSTANWTKHDFLGRPEPIYTYNNTERTGTLSWMIIVDHPTILNILVQKELANKSDQDVEDILAAFFSGCLEYDIFELARIWGVFSNSDIQFFKDVINGKYPYPLDITNDKKIKWNYDVSATKVTIPKPEDDDKLKADLANLRFFFPNDVPAVGDTSTYDQIYEDYATYLTTAVEQTSPNSGKAYDYFRTIGYDSPTDAQYFVKAPATAGDKTSLDIRAKWADIQATIGLINTYVTNHPDTAISVKFEAYASTLSPDADAYNQALAKRRAQSVANWYVKELTPLLGVKITSEEVDDNDGTYHIYLKKEDNPIIDFHANFATDVRGRTVQQMFEDVGWGYVPPAINQTQTPDVINLPNITQAFNRTPVIYKKADNTEVRETTYLDDQFTSTKYDPDRYFSVQSYPASYARRVQLNVETNLYEKTETKKAVNPIGTETSNPVGYSDYTDERNKVINKRDIATRILNRLIGENEYFEFLSKDSPVIFSSLKEKLKYFSPAFHSMTPEGLNSRLTFLQQCVRPGDTMKIMDTKNNAVINTSFGRPPVCILRIGDFYNTKMIIENITIDYTAAAGSVTYDLNPEGIGVQPMIAKVTMTVKYIGGAGLREPVAQLQNALSYNFYANADMHETMSFGQTDADERYLENLELAYNSDVLDIKDLNLDTLDRINIKPSDTQFSQLGEFKKKYEPISLNSPDYNANHKIQEGLDVVQYYDYDYAKLFQAQYAAYVRYMNNYYIPLDEMLSSDATKWDFFALQYGAYAGATNFGSREKISNQFNHDNYPNLVSKLAAEKNYFTIGYDSFNKSKAVAAPKIHLYPQVEDRVSNVNNFNIKDIAGVTIPRYIDLDYVTKNLSSAETKYINYIASDQWAPLLATFNSDTFFAYNDLTVDLQHTFRQTMLTKFLSYVGKMSVNSFQYFADQRSSFVDLYKNVLAVNTVVNGVDGGTLGTQIRYLEVVPNLSGSTGEISTFFNFTVGDCLGNYPVGKCLTPLSNYTYTYGEVAALPDTNQRGVFNYLSGQTSSPTWQPESRLYYDFSGDRWMLNGSPAANINCKTVFEKMNFEQLYFCNLTQAALAADTMSAKFMGLGVASATRTIDTRLSPARLTNIRINLSLSNNATEYTYNRFRYVTLSGDTSDQTLMDKVALINAKGVSAEDVIYYGFIRQFKDPAYLKSVFDVMLLRAISIREQNLVATFCNKIGAIAQYNDFDAKLQAIMTVYGNLYPQTQAKVSEVLDTVQSAVDVTKGGYQLKMFEVSGSRVNSFGRGAMTEYQRFAAQNQTTR